MSDDDDDASLRTKPLDVPGGVSLLFLDARGKSETLVLHDTERPNGGITFATQEAVQETRDMLPEG